MSCSTCWDISEIMTAMRNMCTHIYIKATFIMMRRCNFVLGGKCIEGVFWLIVDNCGSLPNALAITKEWLLDSTIVLYRKRKNIRG